MKKTSKIAMGIGALIVATVAASPALAEGSWTSYITGAKIGFESRAWADRDLDQVPTTVKFTGCSVSGTTFSSTGVTLYQDTLIPFFYTNHGLLTNTCNTVSWSQALGSGIYHFTIERINGSSTTTRTFSANTVVAGY